MHCGLYAALQLFPGFVTAVPELVKAPDDDLVLPLGSVGLFVEPERVP